MYCVLVFISDCYFKFKNECTTWSSPEQVFLAASPLVSKSETGLV